MRQIGVGQYIGEHPAHIHWLKEIERNFAERKLEERTELLKLVPARRFLKLADSFFGRPMKHKFPYVFSYEQKAMIELEPMKDADFPDIESSSEFIVLLRSVYVLDTIRGQGVGSEILKQIKRLAEEAGCMIALYVSFWGLSKNGGDMMAFIDFGDLLHAALVDGWDTVYDKELGDEALKFFYSNGGFQNVCLSSPNSMYEDNGRKEWKKHFAYLPPSLEQKYRQAFAHRLNPELSNFCDCN